VGKVLTATSASTATWQAPASITTLGTTVVNRLVTWGDTTGDTLTQASVKLDSTTFKNTSDVNLVVIDGTNAALGVGVLANVTSGSENVAVGDEALNILTTGGTNRLHA
jgi:hypothetical protein